MQVDPITNTVSTGTQDPPFNHPQSGPPIMPSVSLSQLEYKMFTLTGSAGSGPICYHLDAQLGHVTRTWDWRTGHRPQSVHDGSTRLAAHHVDPIPPGGRRWSNVGHGSLAGRSAPMALINGLSGNTMHGNGLCVETMLEARNQKVPIKLLLPAQTDPSLGRLSSKPSNPPWDHQQSYRPTAFLSTGGGAS